MTDLPTPSESFASTALPTSGVLPKLTGDSLAGRQQVVYEALAEKDDQLGERGVRLSHMYRGAVLARRQSENSERLVLAAHDFRELMEKLPRYLDVPVAAGSGLTVKVREVVAVWDEAEAQKNTADHPTLRDRFLQAFADFAQWFAARDTGRRERAGELLSRLDHRKLPVPSSIRELRVDEWDQCHRYFEGVSHHTLTTSDGDFDDWAAVLEEFLLDRLRPRTYEDRKVLRDIIGEAENDA